MSQHEDYRLQKITERVQKRDINNMSEKNVNSTVVGFFIYHLNAVFYS